MISDEELDLMKRQNERNAKYLHRMGRDGVRANRHRTALLAEVDRQRAEIERLRAALKGIDALNPDALDALVASDLRVVVAQMGDLARNALEGKP